MKLLAVRKECTFSEYSSAFVITIVLPLAMATIQDAKEQRMRPSTTELTKS